MSPVGEGAALPADPARSQAPTRRNVPLMIGLGCVLGFVGLLVAASLLLAGVTVASITIGIRSSDAFKLALAAAEHDATVVSELGAPVEAGWFTPGNIEVTGPTGKADLAIPISGPRGSGTIYLAADKSAGKWTFRTLRVDIEGRATSVDLLAAAPPP